MGPDADPQPPARRGALCKKGLQLDWDWVVLFCFPANWVSGTGRTGQSGLSLAAGWGCGRAGGPCWQQLGAKDQFTFSPQPCSGASGASAVQRAQLTQQLRAPRASGTASTCSQLWIPPGRPRLRTRWGVSVAPKEPLDPVGGLPPPPLPPRDINTSVVSPAVGWPAAFSHTYLLKGSFPIHRRFG